MDRIGSRHTMTCLPIMPRTSDLLSTARLLRSAAAPPHLSLRSAVFKSIAAIPARPRPFTHMKPFLQPWKGTSQKRMTLGLLVLRAIGVHATSELR